MLHFSNFPFTSHLMFALIKIIFLLIAIAYYTLAERKIMAAVQRRRGPNVVGLWGLLQPLADGLKLLAKELLIPSHANSRIFIFAPISILTLSLLSWSVIPFYLYDPLEFISLQDSATLLIHENGVMFFAKGEPPNDGIGRRIFNFVCSGATWKALGVGVTVQVGLELLINDPLVFWGVTLVGGAAYVFLDDYFNKKNVSPAECTDLPVAFVEIPPILPTELPDDVVAPTPSYILVDLDAQSYIVIDPNISSNDFSWLFHSVDGISSLSYGLLFLLALSSLNVYGIIVAGWSSSSKYAFLGSLRSAAQMISYEVAISLVIVTVVLLSGSLDLVSIVEIQAKSAWFVVPLLPSGLIFLISMLAETNRAPFDLPEAEAELVAGYNVEYSSIIFAMFFLGEYSNMILMSSIAALLFFGGWSSPFIFASAPYLWCSFTMAFKTVIICIFFVLVRASYPRYRYDQLMDIGWKVFLPVVTGFLLFELGLLWTLYSLPAAAEVLPCRNLTIDQLLFNPNEIGYWFTDLTFSVPALLNCFNFHSFWLASLGYLLPSVVVVFCFLVSYLPNPVHSLLALMAAFFHIVLLLLSIKVEFLALVFLIIYVGAVAILFLFVLMLFNLKVVRSAGTSVTRNQSRLFGFALPFVFKLYFYVNVFFNDFVLYGVPCSAPVLAGRSIKQFVQLTFYDVQAIGLTLYSDYAAPFIVIGFILLAAMVGSIILAMHTVDKLRRPYIKPPLTDETVMKMYEANWHKASLNKKGLESHPWQIQPGVLHKFPAVLPQNKASLLEAQMLWQCKVGLEEWIDTGRRRGEPIENTVHSFMGSEYALTNPVYALIKPAALRAATKPHFTEGQKEEYLRIAAMAPDPKDIEAAILEEQTEITRRRMQ